MEENSEKWQKTQKNGQKNSEKEEKFKYFSEKMRENLEALYERLKINQYF